MIYPKTDDPLLNKDAFRTWQLIRLPAELGGDKNDVSAFRVYSAVCLLADSTFNILAVLTGGLSQICLGFHQIFVNIVKQPPYAVRNCSDTPRFLSYRKRNASSDLIGIGSIISFSQLEHLTVLMCRR